MSHGSYDLAARRAEVLAKPQLKTSFRILEPRCGPLGESRDQTGSSVDGPNPGAHVTRPGHPRDNGLDQSSTTSGAPIEHTKTKSLAKTKSNSLRSKKSDASDGDKRSSGFFEFLSKSWRKRGGSNASDKVQGKEDGKRKRRKRRSSQGKASGTISSSESDEEMCERPRLVKNENKTDMDGFDAVAALVVSSPPVSDLDKMAALVVGSTNTYDGHASMKSLNADTKSSQGPFTSFTAEELGYRPEQSAEGSDEIIDHTPTVINEKSTSNGHACRPVSDSESGATGRPTEGSYTGVRAQEEPPVDYDLQSLEPPAEPPVDYDMDASYEEPPVDYDLSFREDDCKTENDHVAEGDTQPMSEIITSTDNATTDTRSGDGQVEVRVNQLHPEVARLETEAQEHCLKKQVTYLGPVFLNLAGTERVEVRGEMSPGYQRSPRSPTPSEEEALDAEEEAVQTKSRVMESQSAASSPEYKQLVCEAPSGQSEQLDITHTAVTREIPETEIAINCTDEELDGLVIDGGIIQTKGVDNHPVPQMKHSSSDLSESDNKCNGFEAKYINSEEIAFSDNDILNSACIDGTFSNANYIASLECVLKPSDSKTSSAIEKRSAPGQVAMHPDVKAVAPGVTSMSCESDVLKPRLPATRDINDTEAHDASLQLKDDTNNAIENLKIDNGETPTKEDNIYVGNKDNFKTSKHPSISFSLSTKSVENIITEVNSDNENGSNCSSEITGCDFIQVQNCGVNMKSSSLSFEQIQKLALPESSVDERNQAPNQRRDSSSSLSSMSSNSVNAYDFHENKRKTSKSSGSSTSSGSVNAYDFYDNIDDDFPPENIRNDNDSVRSNDSVVEDITKKSQISITLRNNMNQEETEQYSKNSDCLKTDLQTFPLVDDSKDHMETVNSIETENYMINDAGKISDKSNTHCDLSSELPLVVPNISQYKDIESSDSASGLAIQNKLDDLDTMKTIDALPAADSGTSEAVVGEKNPWEEVYEAIEKGEIFEKDASLKRVEKVDEVPNNNDILNKDLTSSTSEFELSNDISRPVAPPRRKSKSSVSSHNSSFSNFSSGEHKGLYQAENVIRDITTSMHDTYDEISFKKKIPDINTTVNAEENTLQSKTKSCLETNNEYVLYDEDKSQGEPYTGSVIKSTKEGKTVNEDHITNTKIDIGIKGDHQATASSFIEPSQSKSNKFGRFFKWPFNKNRKKSLEKTSVLNGKSISQGDVEGYKNDSNPSSISGSSDQNICSDNSSNVSGIAKSNKPTADDKENLPSSPNISPVISPDSQSRPQHFNPDLCEEKSKNMDYGKSILETPSDTTFADGCTKDNDNNISLAQCDEPLPVEVQSTCDNKDVCQLNFTSADKDNTMVVKSVEIFTPVSLLTNSSLNDLLQSDITEYAHSTPKLPKKNDSTEMKSVDTSNAMREGLSEPLDLTSQSNLKENFEGDDRVLTYPSSKNGDGFVTKKTSDEKLQHIEEDQLTKQEQEQKTSNCKLGTDETPIFPAKDLESKSLEEQHKEVVEESVEIEIPYAPEYEINGTENMSRRHGETKMSIPRTETNYVKTKTHCGDIDDGYQPECEIKLDKHKTECNLTKTDFRGPPDSENENNEFHTKWGSSSSSLSASSSEIPMNSTINPNLSDDKVNKKDVERIKTIVQPVLHQSSQQQHKTHIRNANSRPQQSNGTDENKHYPLEKSESVSSSPVTSSPSPVRPPRTPKSQKGKLGKLLPSLRSPSKREPPAEARNSCQFDGDYHRAYDVTADLPEPDNIPPKPLRQAARNKELPHTEDTEAAPALEVAEDPMTSQTRHFVVVAVDFGTTHSGYAFSFVRDASSVYMMRRWAGEEPGVVNQKTLTSLLLTPEGLFHSFGYSARSSYLNLIPLEARHWLYFSTFKMELHHNANLNRDTTITAANGVRFPALQVFSFALEFFKDHALQQLSDQSGTELLAEDIRWVITVPAIWRAPAKQFMRQAAYQAGMASPDTPEQLLIALEPEAASIFCRRLRMHQLVPEEPIKRELKSPAQGSSEVNTEHAVTDLTVGQDTSMTSSEATQDTPTAPDDDVESRVSGSRYLVVDCGGGTVDITVHELTSAGHITELHRATGGPYGSIGVDKEFEGLLCAIFGIEFIEFYKQKYPMGWVHLMTDFESRKRSASPHKQTPLNVSPPFTFINEFKKYKSDMETAVRRYGDAGVEWSPQGMLRLAPTAMAWLFLPTLTHIKQAVGDVLNHPDAKDLKYMFLVGGFSESPLLQHDLRTEFSHLVKVIIPQEVSLAILKGAVQFGLDPSIVLVRRSRLTYGVGILHRHDPALHPLDKLVHRDGVDWCTDVFDKYVTTDQPVMLGTQVVRSYTPARPGQTNIVLNIYSSANPQATFITDDGVSRCGKLCLTLPACEQAEDPCGEGKEQGFELKQLDGKAKTRRPPPREIQARMSFGDTEIHVVAVDLASGKVVKATVDFMGR